MGIYRLSDRLVRLETACPRAADDARARRLYPSPVCHAAKIALLLASIAPTSVLGAARDGSPMHQPGYKTVPVYYEPLNKMIMPVRINGQPAKLLVDTGSNQLILDADAAKLYSVGPSQRAQSVPRQTFWSFRYIRYTEINGELLPVGFVQNISAGGMKFGGSLVTLCSLSHSGRTGTGRLDGMLGLDILLRH